MKKATIKINKSGIILFIGLIILKTLFDIICTNVLPIFTANLTNTPNVEYCVISWILYIIQIFVITQIIQTKTNVSTVIYTFLFIINGIGYYTLYGRLKTMETNFFLLINLFWFIFSLTLLFLNKKEKNNHQTKDIKIHKNEIIFYIFVAAFTILLSWKYGNFRMFIAFSDVYEYRMNLNMPTIIGYIFRFTSGVFLPYFFTRFLIVKNYKFMLLTLAFALLLFGIDGLKTNLVLYFAIFAINILFKITSKKEISPIKLLIYFCFFFSIFIIINYLGYLHNGNYYFIDEIYRVFLIPDIISNNYYNFIVNKDALLLRESIMRVFFESPYQESINYLVSNTVTKYGRAVANTGMIGDAYANFKIFGVCSYPILYSLVLYFWQKLNNNKINTLSISLGFIMIWNAINISFFTWLITGGVVIYFVITKLFKNKKEIGGQNDSISSAI